MDKPSFLSLLLLSGVALIFAYEAAYPPASGPSLVGAMGMSAFFILCASLLIGPVAVLRPKFGLPLIGARRAVGLAAFVFALLHALIVIGIVLGWNLAFLISQTPLAVGLAALLAILAITLTSNDWAERHLGAGRWKTIQRLNYLAFALALWHFIMMAKSLPFRSGAAPATHWAETALLLLGILTIIAQIAGFWVRRSRRGTSAADEAAGLAV